MAELIDREAFLKRFTSEYRCKFTFGEAKILNVMFEELKKEPTTTESEIRAMAIDDFFDELQKYEDDDWLKLKMSSVYEIAEELKEREL